MIDKPRAVAPSDVLVFGWPRRYLDQRIPQRGIAFERFYDLAEPVSILRMPARPVLQVRRVVNKACWHASDYTWMNKLHESPGPKQSTLTP
jgi:hypothetical protein